MNKWRYSFAGGALVAGAGVAALLLGLPGVRADGAPGTVAVHAVDYAYQGVPGTLATGEIRFSFTNDSKNEGHEMSLFRINDGVNQSFDQILAEDEARQNQQAQAQPDGQGGQGGQGGQSGQSGQGGQSGQKPSGDQNPPPPKMTFFAGTGAAPGDSAKMDLIGKLPPGRYGMACFLPVANDQAGTPHYKKGMKAEFTVK